MKRRYFWDREAKDWVERPRPAAHGGVAVIHDTMDHTLNHADGRHYDSKRAFAAATRAAGMVEVGNEMGALQRNVEKAREAQDVANRVAISENISRAEHMLREGYKAPRLPRVRGAHDIRGDAW